MDPNGLVEKVSSCLESLSDRAEVFAFLTPGTLRVRCVYARARERTPWWRFESLVEASRVEPVRDTSRAGIADRPLVFWGSLRDLSALHEEGERPGVRLLLDHARALEASAAALRAPPVDRG
jgi:hypothetical protein